MNVDTWISWLEHLQHDAGEHTRMHLAACTDI